MTIQKTLIDDSENTLDNPLYNLLFTADSKMFSFYIHRGNSQFTSNLHNLTKILASVCDGAQSLDGQGFSKFDEKQGHYIAEYGLIRFDDYKIRKWAQRMYRYRHQFAGSYLQRLFVDDNSE